jgi:hypothetical protein
MNYKDMNSQQLRIKLDLENSRILGANDVRKTVQMYACVLGYFGWIIILCFTRNHYSGVQCLALWLGCGLAYWRSKPKKIHYLYYEGWEHEARIVLKDAAYERAHRYFIEEKSKNSEF